MRLAIGLAIGVAIRVAIGLAIGVAIGVVIGVAIEGYLGVLFGGAIWGCYLGVLFGGALLGVVIGTVCVASKIECRGGGYFGCADSFGGGDWYRVRLLEGRVHEDARGLRLRFSLWRELEEGAERAGDGSTLQANHHLLQVFDQTNLTLTDHVGPAVEVGGGGEGGMRGGGDARRGGCEEGDKVGWRRSSRGGGSDVRVRAPTLSHHPCAHTSRASDVG